MSEKTYKIVRFAAENVKRLQAVEITPDGNLVEITGDNGQGKSSLLDAIEMAIGGGKMPIAPIRQGEDSARIVVDLGGLLVTRRFSRREDGTFINTLVVETEDGGKSSSGQSVLDKLIGQLAFDPLAFTRMQAKDQFDTLKGFVPGFDFAANAKARKSAFDDRTDVNRKIKDLKSQVAGISVADDVPDAEIDVSALADDLQKVGEHNASVEARKAKREAVAAEAVRFRAEADGCDTQAADYRRLADEVEAKGVELRTKADDNDKRLAEAGPLPDTKDASEIRMSIDRANGTNALVRDKILLNGLIRQVDAKEEEAKTLNAAIDEADAAKALAIASAKMPVEGIGFADDYITLNGLPFNQASSAEQLRASMAIAMASNPRLRLLIVKDGALLDKQSMQIVADMAKEHDFQVWTETVSSDRPSALVIEDGRIRGEEISKVAAE